MVRGRGRVVIGVLTALAIFVLAADPAVPAGDRDADLTSRAGIAAHVIAKVPAPGVSGGVPRSVAFTPVRLPRLFAVLLVSPLVCLGLVGRFRRLVTDAGHDWRALLVGAPPLGS